ncbi:MAG: hypothetical protein JNG85_02705, partial [Spirochaetaceae bacterium]|nr:hypothetical protein [Spirochaetaceae bacterium]
EGRGLIDKDDIDNSLGLGYDLILKPMEATIEAMRAVGGNTAAAADAMRG